MYSEVDTNNTEAVGKRRGRKCVSVAIVRGKNRARRPIATKISIKKQIKK